MIFVAMIAQGVIRGDTHLAQYTQLSAQDSAFLASDCSQPLMITRSLGIRRGQPGVVRADEPGRPEGRGRRRRAFATVADIEPGRRTGDPVAAGAALAAAGEGGCRQGHEGLRCFVSGDLRGRGDMIVRRCRH